MEQEGYLKLVKYCLYRERCISEVRKKLKQTDLPSSQYPEIIQKLQEDGYLDERRYVDIYVRGKFSLKKWGRKKIEFQLRQKQIPAELINEVIQELDDSDYSNTLRELIEKKAAELKNEKSLFDRNTKIIRYLMNKGYEYDQIKKVLSEMK